VNNCIGFWNRKQFVLLLIYTLLNAYTSFIIISFNLWYKLPSEYEKFNRDTQNYAGFGALAIQIISWVITGAASYLMTNFLRFHIDLILSNKTTIEFLEKKGEHFESQYCLSPIENWRQVFGYNKMLWFFPVSWASGHPIGDGVYWPLNQNAPASQRNHSPQNHSERKENPNSEDKRLIKENNSEGFDPDNSANSFRRDSENKENIHQQPHPQSSSRGHLQYAPGKPSSLDQRIDTVVNRKDDTNTLIVHSQDKNRMLKNTLIK